MSILNYSTSIDCEKTAGEIQKILSSAGANKFMSEYDSNGVFFGMAFMIGNFSFILPLHADKVYVLICKDGKIPKKYKTKEQAARVAMRILKDWIEAQVARIQIGQAEIMEVFLSYAQLSNGKTLYKNLVDNGFKLLSKID